jgi:hypothetical protein
MKNKVYFLLIISAAFNCKVIDKRENNPQDIKRAEELLDKFYQKVSQKDFDGAADYFGGETTKAEGKSVLIKIDSLWGSLKNYQAIWAQTSVSETNGKVEGILNLKYKTGYERSLNNEENVFLVFVNDSLYISGYHSTQILN